MAPAVSRGEAKGEEGMSRTSLMALLLLAVPMAVRAQVADPGQALFRNRCGGCHLAGGFGTRDLARRVDPKVAELEKRKDLKAVYVRAIVRNGLSSMPPIRKAELGDGDLAKIAAYLEKGNGQ